MFALAALYYFIAVTTVSAVIETPSLHYLEAANLFRSEARLSFESDEHFIAKHREFEAKLRDPTQNHFGKFHPFTVGLRKDCYASCHEKLKTTLGSTRYSILDPNYAIVHATLHEIEDLQKLYPEIVRFGVPMIPELKVMREVTELAKIVDENECEKTIAESVSLFQGKRVPTKPKGKVSNFLKLRLTLAAVDELTTMNEFFGYASQMETAHKDKFQFEYNPKLQKAGNQHYAFVTVSGCQQLSHVATMFAHRPEVLLVEREYSTFLHNRWSKGVCDTGTAFNTPLNDANITGQDEIIGVTDTGIDMHNCYFRDEERSANYVSDDTANTTTANLNQRKVIQYINYADSGEDSSGHGTHVAGIAAGAPLLKYGDYLKYQGLAYDAKISFFDIGAENATRDPYLLFPGNIRTGLFDLLYDSGARILTNSWGNKKSNYDSRSQQSDEFMWENEDALLIYSAGNEGESGSSTVGSPAVSKNALAVGASANAWQGLYEEDTFESREDTITLTMVSFSSIGPTGDDRLKPDVAAPGMWATSALGDLGSTEDFCALAALKGTSMSAPAAAAHAAKIRQYFLQGYYPTGSKNAADSFTPSGSLLKAMLVHSAQQMSFLLSDQDLSISTITASYPDTRQGYGKIQMDAVLNFAQSTTTPITLFVVGSSDSSSSHYAALTDSSLTDTYTFSTDSSSSQASIRLTFAYTDYRGSTSGSSSRMINTLSVSITSSTSQVFSPYLTSGLIQSNLQVIDIANPTASTTYTVTVTASGLTQSPQPYSLVITGQTTYLSDSPDDTDTASDGSSSFTVTGGALPYVLFLAITVGVLIYLTWFFRKITKRKSSILLDPRNFEVTDAMYEEQVMDTGMGGKKSIFAKIRNIRSASKTPPAATQTGDDGFQIYDPKAFQ